MRRKRPTAILTSTANLYTRYGPRYRWYAVVTVMLGATSMVLESTIINVAIPGIMAHFGMGQDTAQWLSAGFLAAMTATMLTAAWCVQALGQRRAYLYALVVFIIASLIGGLSNHTELVIAARILQGAMAGVIQPLAMITIFQVFPPEQRGRSMAMYGMGVVLAPALGPAVGGYLVDLFSWRAIFFVTMPFCIAALYLVPRYMPERAPGATRPPFDWIGLILLTTFVFTMLDGFHSGHREGWSSTPFLWRAVVALATGGGFILWELSTPHRILELRLFREPGFAAASVVAVAYGMGLYGSTYVVPLFTQTIARYSAAQSGLLLLPGGLVLAATILVAGRLSDRLSSHYVIMSGLACFSASFLLFATGDGATAFAAFALWIIIGRVGLGSMIPSLSAGALQAIRPEFLTQGTGAINFLRQFGGALGVNLLSLILEWRSTVHAAEADGRTQAFHDSFLALALIFLLAMIPAWMMRREPRTKPSAGFGDV
jgi:DHA2 family multidrug resistance protein